MRRRLWLAYVVCRDEVVGALAWIGTGNRGRAKPLQVRWGMHLQKMEKIGNTIPRLVLNGEFILVQNILLELTVNR